MPLATIYGGLKNYNPYIWWLKPHEIGISLGKNMKKKKEENVKDEKYVWIKNGPSVTTFYEPSEISPEFKESLFFLKLVHKKEEDKK